MSTTKADSTGGGGESYPDICTWVGIENEIVSKIGATTSQTRTGEFRNENLSTAINLAYQKGGAGAENPKQVQLKDF